MSVPNYSNVPKKLHDTGLFNLKTEDGQGAFTDAVVATLHGLDERWGHLKKKPGQSHVHHHGEDSALYLHDDPGMSQAVDFIGGAGGSNPQPGWIVDDPRYSRSDWADPFEHGFGESTPPPVAYIPSYSELGDDQWHRTNIGIPLQADMASVPPEHGGGPLNDGSSVWFSRTIYECIAECAKAGTVIDRAPIVRKYRNQWRAILGLPPL